jgi:hypothetical protein
VTLLHFQVTCQVKRIEQVEKDLNRIESTGVTEDQVKKLMSELKKLVVSISYFFKLPPYPNPLTRTSLLSIMGILTACSFLQYKLKINCGGVMFCLHYQDRVQIEQLDLKSNLTNLETDLVSGKTTTTSGGRLC